VNDNNHPQRPFRIVLALSDTTHLDAWLTLAKKFLPSLEAGEIRLRGMVAVQEGKSLSEGALQARQLRDDFEARTRSDGGVLDGTEIRVDYQPLKRVLDELSGIDADLLLVNWAGPGVMTGGLSTDEILAQASCDVVLVSGNSWCAPGPVLLSLRGGPNLSLGMRTAEALSGDSPITLFCAADKRRVTAEFNPVIQNQPRITRVVTAFSGIAESILKESDGHKVVVLGATFRLPEANTGTSGPIISQIAAQTTNSLVLVRARRPEALEFHKPLAALFSALLNPQPKADSLSTKTDRWFAENTFHSSEFADLSDLLALKEKQGITISIGLPALNEEETVGKVILTLKRALMENIPLVDEIVLIDSNSTDNTIAIAEGCRIPTYKHPEILPEVGSYAGKGEALWKSLHVLRGDIVAWIDTDITNIHPRFIYGLIGPLLKRPQVQYVKGFYQRPIKVGDKVQAHGGGRVTELVARPLLNLFYPELSGVIQPLSGEYAGRRTALEQLPFFSGYGVETGLLIDLLERFGLEAIAQSDLEERVHHNQPLVGLSKMSFAILQVFISRLESRYGAQLLDKANRSMKLIQQEPDRFALEIVEISDVERPAMMTIPTYQGMHQPVTIVPNSDILHRPLITSG
jgi:hypothetical protein